jgi:hypothetical protein
MKDQKLFLGNCEYIQGNNPVTGGFVELEGERWFKIGHHDRMDPFLMTLVSPSDHWMFISSNGGLTAGRKSPQYAIFPYYTDDILTDHAENTGSKTILKVKKKDRTYLWEPFSNRNEGAYYIERNLYKNRIGNRVIFEEINHDLSVEFSYEWTFSNRFGVVKKSALSNRGNQEIQIEILDGVQNIIPWGVPMKLQNERSNLTHAYKKNEWLKEGLAIFRLSSMIIDRAEPSEALKATTAWSVGLRLDKQLLSALQLNAYRRGLPIQSEEDIKAERGAFFIHQRQSLKAGKSKNWYIVLETAQDASDVVKLKHLMDVPGRTLIALQEDLKATELALKKLVAHADGVQYTADALMCNRHYSNTLFNSMRGGVFFNDYNLETSYFKNFVQDSNRRLFQTLQQEIQTLPVKVTLPELRAWILNLKNEQLMRLGWAYLPIFFSRRHGDPSRPWNSFSISTHDSNGKPVHYYEGNWRDIFQNWEALGQSYPMYLEGMIYTFLNASTPDGYNPYRITRNGIDWEIEEKDDPWSYIGYWGDHQLIYFLKFLEALEHHMPGRLNELMHERHFAYAHVPYRIKSYAAIKQNPSDTLEFLPDLHHELIQAAEDLGSDGKLVHGGDYPVLVSMGEKILVQLLTKLYNFIPGAGIWMNTQRPEWNDANNALVGNGASMVTLCYLRRYIQFLLPLLESSKFKPFEVNSSVGILFEDLKEIFSHELKEGLALHNQTVRRNFVDHLGRAGERYREVIYQGIPSEQVQIKPEALGTFLEQVKQVLDLTIHFNKRYDNLYHSYNLIEFTDEELHASHLYPMLEGQVAILSAGLLSPKEAVILLDSLRESPLYRSDQYSYLLYPNRDLPLFLARNHVPKEWVNISQLAKKMIRLKDETILQTGIDGIARFNSNFHNAEDLNNALDSLVDRYGTDVEAERQAFLNQFETQFKHKQFTGRSGTFFGYEGLGSIYWHMVSKLLLAVMENLYTARQQSTDPKTLGKLIEHYYEIRAGIGINKSPDLYGAFPTDAYSHTPENRGAQQPGMTGQVKEDILSRWGELGLKIEQGTLVFAPFFLKKEEFIQQQSTFRFYSLEDKLEHLELPKGSLAFMYCGIPILYHLGKKTELLIRTRDGKNLQIQGNKLPEKWAKSLFERDAAIRCIEYTLPEGQLI